MKRLALAHLATVTVSVGVATRVPENSSNSSSKCNYTLTGGNVIPAQPRGGCAPNLDRSFCKADHMPCTFSSTVGCLPQECAGEPHSIKCKSVCLDPCFPHKNCKVDSCSCSAPRVAHEDNVSMNDTLNDRSVNETMNGTHGDNSFRLPSGAHPCDRCSCPARTPCPPRESFTFTGNFSQACGVWQSSARSDPTPINAASDPTGSATSSTPAASPSSTETVTPRVTDVKGAAFHDRVYFCDQPALWIVLVVLGAMNFLLLFLIILFIGHWLLSHDQESNRGLKAGPAFSGRGNKKHHDSGCADGQAHSGRCLTTDHFESLSSKLAQAAFDHELLSRKVDSLSRKLDAWLDQSGPKATGQIDLPSQTVSQPCTAAEPVTSLCKVVGPVVVGGAILAGHELSGGDVAGEDKNPGTRRMEKELPPHLGQSLKRDQPESGRFIPSIEQPQFGTYQSRWTKRATESAALTEFARTQLVGDLGSFRQAHQRGQDTQRTEALFDESGSEEVEVCRDAGGLDWETAIDDMKDWRAENSRHKGQVAEGSKSGWLSTPSKVKLGANSEEVQSHAI